MSRIEEVYQHIQSAISRLEESGVALERKPSGSRNNLEIVSRYSGPERLPSGRWGRVTFRVPDPATAEGIFQEASTPRAMGILFDCGGMACYRDWEVGCSLHWPDDLPRSDLDSELVEGVISSHGLPQSWQEASNEGGMP